MKKGQVLEGTVEKIKFPNKGIVCVEESANKEQTEIKEQTAGNEQIGNAEKNRSTSKKKCVVKNVLPGQKIRFSVNKIRSANAEGCLLEVLEKSPVEIDSPCRHFSECGGCAYQTLPYEEQLHLKESQIRELLDVENASFQFDGIKGSPVQIGYRNKMEFSFGDSSKGGILELGMHKRGSFYDIVSVKNCQIIDEDYRQILDCTLSYFREKDTSFYHKLSHEGYLRHLLVRKAIKTGEILIDLITTSQTPPDTICMEKGLLADWQDQLCSLRLQGTIVGILHTWNDSLADTVQNDRTDILYGKDFFYEEILGLKFKISPFSFFQTNSLGAEVLYETAREFVLSCGSANDKTIFDLYSGTGTIAQLLAPVAKKIIGVEIVEEAVAAATQNAALNGLHNCDFIAGDVLKVLDELEEKPDFIVLDPPRDGVHPKALKKIINYGVENIVYISCKPTSLVRDLEMLSGCGYQVKRVCAIDQFPGTVHVETVVLMSRVDK